MAGGFTAGQGWRQFRSLSVRRCGAQRFEQAVEPVARRQIDDEYFGRAGGDKLGASIGARIECQAPAPQKLPVFSAGMEYQFRLGDTGHLSFSRCADAEVALRDSGNDGVGEGKAAARAEPVCEETHPVAQ